MLTLNVGAVDYAHHVPGRLRVCVPAVKGHQAIASSLAETIRRAKGVQSVRASAVTGSVVIQYDCRQTSHQNLLILLKISEPLPTAIRAASPHRIPARTSAVRRVPKTCTCGAGGYRQANPFVDKIGPWLLNKTLEIALERSALMLIGALL